MPWLLLIRHAEAVTHAPDGDLERSLTARGAADAVRMGAYCHTAGLMPELALVSPARRARETLDVMAREFPRKPACEIANVIYDSDVGTMQDLLEQISSSIKTLLIVGHNPGLAEFARFLIDGEENSGSPLIHFPAPCLALLHFNGANWMAAGRGRGRLHSFMNFSCVPADDLLAR